MDILYYSNHCPNSQKVIQYIAKFNFIDKINAICIDKRSIDKVSGQVFVQLENGKKIMLPPNVHSVPALLIVKNRSFLFFARIDPKISNIQPFSSGFKYEIKVSFFHKPA